MSPSVPMPIQGVVLKHWVCTDRYRPRFPMESGTCTDRRHTGPSIYRAMMGDGQERNGLYGSVILNEPSVNEDMYFENMVARESKASGPDRITTGSGRRRVQNPMGPIFFKHREKGSAPWRSDRAYPNPHITRRSHPLVQGWVREVLRDTHRGFYRRG